MNVISLSFRELGIYFSDPTALKPIITELYLRYTVLFFQSVRQLHHTSVVKEEKFFFVSFILYFMSDILHNAHRWLLLPESQVPDNVTHLRPKHFINLNQSFICLFRKRSTSRLTWDTVLLSSASQVSDTILCLRGNSMIIQNSWMFGSCLELVLRDTTK